MNKKEPKIEPHRVILPILIVAMSLFIVIMLGKSMNLNMFSKNKSQLGVNSSTEPPNDQMKRSIQAVIKKMDVVNQELTVYNMATNQEEVYGFDTWTEAKNRYYQIILLSELPVGEIVTLSYQIHDKKIYTCEVNTEAWEYKKASNISIEKEAKMMKVGTKSYKYEDSLVVVTKDKVIDLNALHDKDELTVKGIGEQIYSIIVTRGHGTLKLTNYEAFLDGEIEVGFDVFSKVKSDMNILVREGDYRITLKKGTLEAIKYVHIGRDEDTILDMSEYKAEEVKQGQVEFEISPNGADLYIEGVETSYDDVVELEYGKYQVKVTLSGYQTYTGSITVDQEYQKIAIDMVSSDKVKETEKPSETPNPSATPIPNSSTELDGNQTIAFTAPEGAEVYMNDTYKGIIPFTTNKVTGSYTITLKKKGYATKQYTIEVYKDGGNATFSFPTMLAE